MGKPPWKTTKTFILLVETEHNESEIGKITKMKKSTPDLLSKISFQLLSLSLL